MAVHRGQAATPASLLEAGGAVVRWVALVEQGQGSRAAEPPAALWAASLIVLFGLVAEDAHLVGRQAEQAEMPRAERAAQIEQVIAAKKPSQLEVTPEPVAQAGGRLAASQEPAGADLGPELPSARPKAAVRVRSLLERLA